MHVCGAVLCACLGGLVTLGWLGHVVFNDGWMRLVIIVRCGLVQVWGIRVMRCGAWIPQVDGFVVGVVDWWGVCHDGGGVYWDRCWWCLAK